MASPFRLFRRLSAGRAPSAHGFHPRLESFGSSGALAPCVARPFPRLRPALETLEPRLVPTGVVATDQANMTYVLLQGGQLYEHDGTDSSTGWHFTWSGVKQVSAGEDAHANPVAFVLLNDGTLYEHLGQDSSTGWHYVWYGVQSVAASAWGADDAFVVLTNGAAYEHVGVDSPNWYFIWNGVQSISAGRDGSSNPAAFVLLQNGQLWEHLGRSSSTGWHYVWYGVNSMSASQLDADDVFVVLNNGTAYKHVGLDSSNWYFIWSGVKQLSAGSDPSYTPNVYVLLNDGSVWRHDGTSSSYGWTYIWNSTASVTGSEIDGNTVYIRLNNATAYEQTSDGQFHYIWFNVAA